MAINQAGQSAEGWLICNYAQQKVANSDATRLDKLTATNCQMKAPPIVVTSSTGQITTYSYNADGQLISTTSFSWNSVFSIPGAIAVNGYSYVYAGGLPVEHIAPNGSVLSYLANREGSTVALTDSTGKVVAHYAYSAHGSIICGPITSPGTTPSGTLSPTSSPPCRPSPPAPPATCPTASQHSPVGHPPCIARAIAANHFLYDGQYLDTVSGLYYLRARWYDPATGHFTSVDALVAITGQSYSYAGGNPVNGGDPLRLLSSPLFHQPSTDQSMCNLSRAFEIDAVAKASTESFAQSAASKTKSVLNALWSQISSATQQALTVPVCIWYFFGTSCTNIPCYFACPTSDLKLAAATIELGIYVAVYDTWLYYFGPLDQWSLSFTFNYTGLALGQVQPFWSAFGSQVINWLLSNTAVAVLIEQSSWASNALNLVNIMGNL